VNARVRITSDSLTPRLQRIVEGLSGSGKRQILGAMGKEYARIARANFGPRGLDRPSNWDALRDKYRRWKQKNYGRGDADLILRGNLRDSIRSECVNDNYSEVIAGEGLAYAAAHQNGEGRMPRRPFFPQRNLTQATPYTEERLREVVERELERTITG
jgi:phage gpG-like protein